MANEERQLRVSRIQRETVDPVEKSWLRGSKVTILSVWFVNVVKPNDVRQGETSCPRAPQEGGQPQRVVKATVLTARRSCKDQTRHFRADIRLRTATELLDTKQHHFVDHYNKRGSYLLPTRPGYLSTSLDAQHEPILMLSKQLDIQSSSIGNMSDKICLSDSNDCMYGMYLGGRAHPLRRRGA